MCVRVFFSILCPKHHVKHQTGESKINSTI